MKKSIFLTGFLICFTLLAVAQKEVNGVITVYKNKILTVKVDATDLLPSKTDTCSISKDISGTKNPFGLTISSGWMGIGNIVLTGSKGNILTFKVIKETSNIVINGKKQENFVVGKKVKIEWKGK